MRKRRRKNNLERSFGVRRMMSATSRAAGRANHIFFVDMYITSKDPSSQQLQNLKNVLSVSCLPSAKASSSQPQALC